METIVYTPRGVCSRKMEFVVDNNIIQSVKIEGGCNSNLNGISRILVGMDVHHVIERFSGVTCGMKPTSCPDQIAQGLKEKFGN